MTTPLDYATRHETPRLPFLDPLLAGVVYAIGVALIAGWPKSFDNADDRIALSAPIAAGVLAVLAPLQRRRAVRELGVVLAALICVLPALWPMLAIDEARRWSAGTMFVAGLACAVLAIVERRMLAGVGERGGSLLVGLLLLGVAAATGGLAAATGSIRIAEKAAPLAIVALLAVVARVAFRRPVGVGPFVVAVVLAQLATARFWSELQAWQAACVIVAPPLAWLALMVPAIVKRRPWLRAAIALLIAATPATIAVGLAAKWSFESASSDGSSDSGGLSY